MIQLQKEFIKNVDCCGDHKFIQVYREDNFAIYERRRLTGEYFAHEIFKIVTIKAGAKLPGNLVVEEDYERYPSKNDFGKTAMFIKITHPSHLKRLFEEFKRLHQTPLEESNNNEVYNFNIPDEPFDIQTLIQINPTSNYNGCYTFIKENLDKTIVFSHEQRSASGRGKPKKFYKKIV